MQRWKHPLLLAYLIVIVGLLFYAYRLETLAQNTNEIVKRDLVERDQTISALEFVLQQQAAPAIVYMQKELRAAGVTPPNVFLTPDEPPFKPPPKENP